MNLGQVYTKEIVADYMVGLFDLPKSSVIIDPCFGQGVFIRSLQKANYNNLIGVEIDPKTFCKINTADYHQCKLFNMDFFQFEPQGYVDGFILNPPYVRQEEIDEMKNFGVSKASIIKKNWRFSNIFKSKFISLFYRKMRRFVKNRRSVCCNFSKCLAEYS